ncbi:DNA-processing protein DprA [Lachnospiraceae bacterium OttesenSCG-928-J05]|nr:DNA-processing protein DprA [Lachnospiraceae bacterium OttesenSCG-928-J05]
MLDNIEEAPGTKIQMISHYDQEYPSKLREVKGHPEILYYTGKLPQEDVLTVAIVGAREPTPYGKKMTRIFAECLALYGVQIISGMARGVDGIAGRGAINKGGYTAAVLGCGVDICYPRSNQGLFKDIAGKGGLISEYPPGTMAKPYHFPARNRLISGLSDAVLVMEAREKSGSLITADMALEQGRDVYALPGPVSSELSRGCNNLLKQGAGVLLSPEELLEDLGINQQKSTRLSKREDNILLTSLEEEVYSCLDLYPKNIEALIEVTKLAPCQIQSILVSLELKGVIKEISKNFYTRV